MEITKHMLKKPGWVFTGLFYGYPLCCIKEFVEPGYLNLEHFPLNGTGYVPCSKCKLKSEAELIETITINRFDTLPFPGESKWGDRERFVNKLIKEGLPDQWGYLKPVLDRLVKNRKLAKK